MPGVRSLFWATILLVCLPRADAQDAPGITVGAPKAFDNRTLNLMLERLSTQLAGNNFFDQKSVAQAIGTVQGSSVQDTASSLSVEGGLPTLPSQAQNSSSANSTSKSSATPSASALPDLIATPGAFTGLKYGPSSSDLLSEQVDLTYQIINLQMLLDRSLSDRLINSSFNARLQTVVGFNVSIDPPRNAENAVAVVEITLSKNTDPCTAGKKCGEPEPCSANAKAVDGPSLVASMPQEHTYNAAALSSKSRAFGGSAVAKLVTVGYTERRRGQTYYMFRDNDTLSFEKKSCPGAGKITFGWAFRPVLGRKSVAPGSRQLFAVVSLPEDDSSNLTSSGAKLDPSVTYAVAIKTYWRKYDPGTLTSANNKEIRPWAKLGHALSLGTSLTYAPSGVTYIPNYQLVVPRTSTYLDHLLPRFQSITWNPIGTKQASIAVKGENLFYDTHIAIGDKLLTGAQDGLRLVSDQGMDIITDISALYGDVSVLGRYGPATPLELEYAKKDLSILSASYDSTALGGYINLTLIPTFDSNNCLQPSDLASKQLGQPIVFINGAVIPGPYQFPPVGNPFPKPFPDDCISVSARVPEASMPKLGGIAMLKFPFRQGISASQRLYNPTTVYHLQTLTADKDFLLLKDDFAFVPSKPAAGITTKNWQLIIGADSPLPLRGVCPATFPKDSNVFCLLTPNENLARIVIGKNYPCSDTTASSAHPPAPAATKGSPAGGSPKKSSPQKGDSKPKTCLPKSFLLQNAQTNKEDGTLQWVATYPIAVSASGDDTTSDSAKPTLDANQKQSVNQHDLVWCSFKGKALSSVSAVTIANSKLEINPSKDGTSIAVFLPEWATAWPAQVDLTFLDKQNTQIGTAQVTVKPNPSGATK